MGDQPHVTDAKRIIRAQETPRPARIKEEEIPIQINRDCAVGGRDGLVRVKEEEFPVEIGSSGFSDRNPAASASRLLYPQEPVSENRNVSQSYQDPSRGYYDVKLEAGSASQWKEEEMQLEIGQDGSYNQLPAHDNSQNPPHDPPNTPHKYQDTDPLKREVKVEQINMRLQTERQSSQVNVGDPLEGRSVDSRFHEYEDEMPDEEYSYSIDSESDDRLTDESEETDDSDDLSPSPPRPLNESTERFLAMLQEQVCPSHLPEPYCFQDDPICSGDRPPSPDVKEENLVGHTEWCECGKCRAMPANSDCLCCRKVENVEEHLLGGLTCVTMSEEFHNRCLNEKVLRYFLEYDRSTTRRDYVEDKNMCLRRAAYRSYTRMIHGFRKKRAFVPIPSCVVCAIRNRFPDPKPYEHLSLDYPASYVAMSVAERG